MSDEILARMCAMTDPSDGNEWWCPRCGRTVPASHVTHDETHDNDCGEPVVPRDNVVLGLDEVGLVTAALHRAEAALAAERKRREECEAIVRAERKAFRASDYESANRMWKEYHAKYKETP